VTPIKIEQIVPLATPDAEMCVDGVCEIPAVTGESSSTE
jgi:hypothetical protein